VDHPVRVEVAVTDVQRGHGLAADPVVDGEVQERPKRELAVLGVVDHRVPPQPI